jgi:hypothetical protein
VSFRDGGKYLAVNPLFSGNHFPYAGLHRVPNAYDSDDFSLMENREMPNFVVLHGRHRLHDGIVDIAIDQLYRHYVAYGPTGKIFAILLRGLASIAFRDDPYQSPRVIGDDEGADLVIVELQ